MTRTNIHKWVDIPISKGNKMIVDACLLVLLFALVVAGIYIFYELFTMRY